MALLCLPACERPEPPDAVVATDPARASAIASEPSEPEPDERTRTLGPFLAEHWQLPIAPQGPAPEGWSEAEASLDPALCGGCHPLQYADWSTSLHAAAFSPGFSGQLLEGSLAEPAALRSCQTCHTPLAEQQPVLASGEPSPHYDPALREQGLVCAGCHVRAHQRRGPPRRADATAAPEPVPHGGFEARAEFQQSRFCAPCHQFFDSEGPNGKPVENTFAEWQASPHAARGETCQSCHMPDRRHLWRGIHDPEMVRGGVETALHRLDAEPGHVRAALVLASVGVGHRFPTYVTPQVVLEIWLEDASERRMPGTRRRAVIAREIDFGSFTEISDTRVAPGESVKLELDRPIPPGAARVVARVTVDPDHFYRNMFEGLLPTLDDPEARARISEAHRRASTSTYVLAEHTAPL